jgi:NADP-dependent 3-hydroxy acid dehydrogenase YdfG
MTKTAIITGASSGIGAATAITLNRAGYNVVLAARRLDKMLALKEQLNGNHLLLETDVTSVDDVENLINKSIEKFGTIDVLVNNAGVGYLGPIAEGKLDEWLTMVNVNVGGLLTCIHKALPHLLKTKGYIFNIASVAAHEVFPGSVVYCATKHAVNAITVGIRKEFRDKIKVCNISPGAVNTEFAMHTTHEATAANFKDYFEKNETLIPQDIADAILEVLNKPERVAINEIIIRPNL